MCICICSYIYTYSGIFFSHKKEGNPAIYNNMMDLEGVMLSEIAKQRKKNIARYHLNVESKKKKKIKLVGAK